MGCSQSKMIESEEAVTRCKDRKQFMKNSVSSRNAFAAAHSSYTMSLKNTGAALSDYGNGEILDQRISPPPSTSQHPPPPPPPPDPLPPPPPPLPNFPPNTLQRAATMPEFVILKPDPKPTETIQEEEDDEDEENRRNKENNDLSLHRRRRKTGGRDNEQDDAPAPPPPPASPPRTRPINNDPIPPPPPESNNAAWEYFFPPVQEIHMPSLSENDVVVSEDNDRFKREENFHGDGIDDIGITATAAAAAAAAATSSTTTTTSSSSQAEARTQEKVNEPAVVKSIKKPKQNIQSNTASVEYKRGSKASSSVSLLEILKELDDHFLKAYQSGYEVSRMLEANRLHYHSNFADNRGHIDHSKRVMRVITWNRSFRGLQNADDDNDDFDAQETLAGVLDKMLAWEKKLYDEVKVSELMKIDYQKKVALLNKLKKRGTNSEALEKSKAAVTHLHTRYIVDMQSLDSTVSEIDLLRDDHLYPKLVSLVYGMAKMWETMNSHHRDQLKIVENIRSLDISQAPPETSEEHHGRTVQLWNVVEDWHSQFRNLVMHQKGYIKALNSWLKLNLIPIESSLKEKVSSPPRVHRPPIHALLQAWNDTHERLPDELARSAIYSFAHIIKNIMLHQEDEVKLKIKWMDTKKELERKTRGFQDWYHKHMQRRTPPDEVDPENDANYRDPVTEKRFVIETLEKRLEEEAEAHQKYCRQVREKSLVSLKTHLPELFRAMSDFSSASTLMYKKLQSIAQSQNPTGSSS